MVAQVEHALQKTSRDNGGMQCWHAMNRLCSAQGQPPSTQGGAASKPEQHWTCPLHSTCFTAALHRMAPDPKKKFPCQQTNRQGLTCWHKWHQVLPGQPDTNPNHAHTCLHHTVAGEPHNALLHAAWVLPAAAGAHNSWPCCRPCTLTVAPPGAWSIGNNITRHNPPAAVAHSRHSLHLQNQHNPAPVASTPPLSCTPHHQKKTDRVQTHATAPHSCYPRYPLALTAAAGCRGAPPGTTETTPHRFGHHVLLQHPHSRCSLSQLPPSSQPALPL